MAPLQINASLDKRMVFFSVCFICLEWVAAICSHASSIVSQSNWKQLHHSKKKSAPPALFVYMFSKGFKNPLGVTVIGGISFLPAFLFANHFGETLITLLNDWVPIALPVRAAWPFIGLWLASGRLLGAAAECWVIKQHVNYLVSIDQSRKSESSDVPALRRSPRLKSR